MGSRMDQQTESQTKQNMDQAAQRRDARRTRRAARARAPRPKRRLRPLEIWTLAFLLCLLCYPRIQAVLSPDRMENAEGKIVSKRDINVLLLGVDERNGDRGRSDTIMLLNYNALTGKLHLLSIPRDTRVRLDKHGYQKINAAYAYGGTDVAKDAVGELLGLRVDYFLKANFDGFSQVVDALGGVTVDIKTRMSYDDPYQDLHIHFEPGRQRLAGEDALEYVRWRGDIGSDLARVERQRDFLNAAFRRAVSPVGLLRSALVLHALDKCIETDMPALMRPGIAASAALSYIMGVETATVPGRIATIGDGSYYVADTKELQELVTSW